MTYLARSHFNLWLGTQLPLSTVKATGCQPALLAWAEGRLSLNSGNHHFLFVSMILKMIFFFFFYFFNQKFKPFVSVFFFYFILNLSMYQYVYNPGLCPDCLHVLHLAPALRNDSGSGVLPFQLCRAVGVVHEGRGVSVVSSAHCKGKHQPGRAHPLRTC